MGPWGIYAGREEVEERQALSLFNQTWGWGRKLSKGDREVAASQVRGIMRGRHASKVKPICGVLQWKWSVMSKAADTLSNDCQWVLELEFVVVV